MTNEKGSFHRNARRALPHVRDARARFANIDDVTALLYAALEATIGGPIACAGAGKGIEARHRVDALDRYLIDDEQVSIAVKVLRHAYPRDVRQAVWALDECRLAVDTDENLIPLVAADVLSPGARQLLRKHGIAYFESNGNLFLRWRRWLIDIERPQLEAATRKVSKTLFSDAREMVIHALLQHRNEWLTGNELAEIARTSTYTTSVVLQELERREWCESSGAGRTLRRRLIQPRLLLDAWAEQWAKRNELRSRYYVFSARPNALLAQLAERLDKARINAAWAFTGTAAANVFAPLLTSVDTVEIAVPPGYARLFAEALRLKPVEQGANVTLLERGGAGARFPVAIPGTSAYVASPFILYLDLLNERGRNKELAQQVLERLQL